MPLISQITPSFNSGEVSPSIYSRVDLDKYKSSLKTARNFILHPQGGCSNRCGSQYINAAKYSSSMCISTEFIFNQTQAYILEFGHYYIRFYTQDSLITLNGAAYEVSTSYTASQVSELRFESSADVIWITHPDHQVHTLTRYADSNWILAVYSPTDGPFMPDNTDDTASLAVSATSGNNINLSLNVSTTIDSNTVALLHFGGVDGSTTITDSSSYGRASTAFGNAQIDTAIKKLGTGSLLLDGSGDYITFGASSALNMGTSNWSIGCYWYPLNLIANPTQTLYSQTNALGTADISIVLQVSANQLRIILSYDGVTSNIDYTATGLSFSINNWYYIMARRNGSNIELYVDGTQVGVSQNIGTNAIFSSTSSVTIGRAIAGLYEVNGQIDEYRVTREAIDPAPPMVEYSTTIVSSVTSYTFDPRQVGTLFKLRHYVEGQVASNSFTGTGSGTAIKCFTTWRLITHGTWTGKLRVEKSLDGVNWFTVLRAFSSANDSNFDTSGTEDIEANPVPFYVRATMYAYTSGTATVDLTTDAFYQEGIFQAITYTSSTVMVVNTVQAAGSTSYTGDWAEGSWSTYRGFPRVARFFQDRLCFASTDSEPQTIWMTVTSNYYSFIRHSTLLDTDGITINLPSRQLNAINGLMAFKKLLAFTSASVWSIGPIATSALTPSSINTDIEEYSGSANINQVVIGSEGLFSDAGGEIIKNIGYQLSSDGYQGDEANILSKHLFEGHTIVKMAYQRNPNSIMWCVRNDGILLALTYMRNQNVVGWTRHDTNGTVKSISVIPYNGYDELWLVVQRTNGYFIERMIGRRQFNISDHVFLDAYTACASTTSVISSLYHLRGMSVSVLADATWLGTMTVSSAGTLGMSSTYSVVDIGLQYLSDFQTLGVDVPLPAGTIQGNKVKIGNVTWELINSRGGYVGPDMNNMHDGFTYEALNAAAEGTLTTSANFSGEVRIPIGASYKKDGSVFYRQYAPFPITIASVVPELDPGGKAA